MLGVRYPAFPSHREEEHEHEPELWQLSIKVVWPFQDKWTVDILVRGQNLSSHADQNSV
jgi:hypothetical protein